MTDKEAMAMALEALEQTLQTLDDENAKPGGAIADTIWHSEHETLFDYLGSGITALKEALAQPEQEPVAWFSPSGNLYKTRFHATANGEQVVTPLYTHPPQRTEPLIGCVNHDCAKCKPLTDEQRRELMSKAWNKWLSNKDDGRLFAWDFSFEVEAAHGIKENT